MRLASLLALCGVLAVPASVLASYDLDGSKWNGNGTVDYSFTSSLYSTSQTGYPVSGDCASVQPWDSDGNPNTIGFNIDVGAMSGGQIPYVAHLTGTLNPTTGALTASEVKSGLHVSFSVTIPGLGTIPMVITDDNITVNATVIGHDWCFISGQWRDTGTTINTTPASSSGTVKGYYDVLFKPTWTLTLTNIRLTFTKCERPGVVISGVLTLDSYGPSPAGLPAAIWVRQGASTEITNVSLASDGSYSVTTHLPGSVDVLAKATHWLRGLDAGVSTNGGNVSGVDFFLINGDVDQDNSVNLIDLGDVLTDFAMSGSPADVDGSGQVNLIDLGIVLTNFAQSGAQ